MNRHALAAKERKQKDSVKSNIRVRGYEEYYSTVQPEKGHALWATCRIDLPKPSVSTNPPIYQYLRDPGNGTAILCMDILIKDSDYLKKKMGFMDSTADSDCDM